MCVAGKGTELWDTCQVLYLCPYIYSICMYVWVRTRVCMASAFACVPLVCMSANVWGYVIVCETVFFYIYVCFTVSMCILYLLTFSDYKYHWNKANNWSTFHPRIPQYGSCFVVKFLGMVSLHYFRSLGVNPLTFKNFLRLGGSACVGYVNCFFFRDLDLLAHRSKLCGLWCFR